jgi:hypothetical protein
MPTVPLSLVDALADLVAACAHVSPLSNDPRPTGPQIAAYYRAIAHAQRALAAPPGDDDQAPRVRELVHTPTCATCAFSNTHGNVNAPQTFNPYCIHPTVTRGTGWVDAGAARAPGAKCGPDAIFWRAPR